MPAKWAMTTDVAREPDVGTVDMALSGAQSASVAKDAVSL
jgi:hypothetical protein